MRMLKAKCNKCGASIKYQIDNLTIEEAKAIFDKLTYFNCPGNHVELAGPLNYVTIDWDNVIDEEEMTDERFLQEKRAKYITVINTKTLREEYEDVTFFAGMALTTRKSTGKPCAFDFGQSPSNERWYFSHD